MRGNPEAVASAYSLYDYEIAADLGGEEALRATCASARRRRGIRLASDMVPNHTGIDSRWVIEHPDWFVSARTTAPIPSYTFNGAGPLRRRARRHPHRGPLLDRDATPPWSSSASTAGPADDRYIYHGNDGTSMPWNDTAQLNYLIPEVREAVIQTILHVARKFPIIRFDAAMTLAKKHYPAALVPRARARAAASRPAPSTA